MSASFASITGVTDSPPPRADHGEFPFSTSMLSARTRREIGPSMFERFGSTRTRRVDVGMVAATNRDLESMIAAREFRSDLYYRLNVFPIRIPPLRETEGGHTAACEFRATSETTPGSVGLREREEIVRIVRETISGMKNEESKNAAREYDERQREEIVRALGETKGRVGGVEGAAARLGINRTTVLARMKKLGIDPREFSCPAM